MRGSLWTTAGALVLIAGVLLLFMFLLKGRAGTVAVAPASAAPGQSATAALPQTKPAPVAVAQVPSVPTSEKPAPTAVRLSPPTVAEPPPEGTLTGVRSEPVPSGSAPQASLLQPVLATAPPASGPQPGTTEVGHPHTAARWPLGAPTLHEPPLAAESPCAAPPAPNWSRPQPLETPPPAVVADLTEASKPATVPVQPAPAGADSVRPMPALAAAPAPSARGRALPFIGTYPGVLEAGGTLVLPSGLRRRLKGPAARSLFVTPGPDESLWLYTADGVERWAEQMAHAGAGPDRVRSARRLSLAQTEACAVDRAGRFRLPDRLTQFAGLQQEVVLIGVGDHLELWDAQRWQEYRQRQGARTVSRPEAAHAHGVARPGTEEACEP